MVVPGTKKTQGKQKIEIKKLENKSNKQVTFSKRRAGLFKKSGELAVLCGAEVAAIVFSPNSNLFCFGHPNPDSVIRRYINYGNATATSAAATTAANSSSSLASAAAEFNREYGEAVKELEIEIEKKKKKKKKKRAADVAKLAAQGNDMEEGFWWWEEEDVDGMGLEEMEHFFDALKEMRKKVANKTQQQHTLLNINHGDQHDGGSTCFGFGFDHGGEF